jgi:hypothetical protein
MTTIKPCEICGKPMKVFASRLGTKRTCSNKCSGELRHKEHPITYVERTCKICGETFSVDVNQIKAGYGTVCSQKCKGEVTRRAHSKGGWVRPDGYRQVMHKGKVWLEHDLVWFLNTGIKPDRLHPIHHKDENKLNNNFDNLEQLSASQHKKLHPNTEQSLEKNRMFHREFCKTRERNEQGRFACSTGT